MADIYATVEEYRARVDDASDDARIAAYLEDMSSELRAAVGIEDGYALTDDQATIARRLVIDACRKALVPAQLEGFGEIVGATQASFSSNGFSASASLQNPSGSAYFDQASLKRLKRLLHRGMRIGSIPVGW